MPFLSLLSTGGDTDQALSDILGQVRDAWTGAVDVALVFFTPQHLAAADKIAEALAPLQARALLGCPGETVVGNEREIEQGPALCLWLGRWAHPIVATPFHLAIEQTSEGYSLLGWPDELVDATPAESLILAVADPFTFPTDDFLSQINDENPGLRVVGGMASGAREPGVHRLIIGNRVLVEGAAGVLLQGPIACRSVVSQGCRPIGKPLVITKARDNIIEELGGKPALAQIQQLWQELIPRDQQLVQQGLHVGRVINEYQETFQRGDFLVRNVIGLERGTGAVAITDRVRVGQTVQFHVRDAASADEDLRLLLRQGVNAGASKPAGALLFSCNGRGTRLFEQPHHDAAAIQQEIGPLPLAGFFAQGELGPVGGQNFIHGFTASVALFEE
ncbi:MAG: FIST C-terminal domain-containing protein [Gemmataceae bacterium]|nr:FIST C-terminal domain-containing protein [Gemmataceae bacterium]